MRRLAPIIETPDEPIDGSLLWIDSTNMEKPSAKIKHANRWISIVGERGEKGEKGDAPKITSDNDGVLYSEGKLLTEVVKDAAIKAIEAARNDLYEYGTTNFDINKIASYLPVMVITGNIPAIEGTTDKNLRISANIKYINLQDPTRNFDAFMAQMGGQGTSSMTYPKKNFRIWFNKSDATILYGADGNVVQNRLYSFKQGAQPVDCWCLKADFAESSGTHNTGVARLWNDVIRNAQINGSYVLRTEAQKCAAEAGYQYDVRTTVDGFPIAVFYHLTEEDNLIFLGKYNFNNDKSTESVFGFRDIPNFDNSNVQCFEFLDSGNMLALFQTIQGFDINWDKAWESRYPDTKTPNLEPLKTLATWIVSTNGNLQKWIDEKSEHFDLWKLASYYVYLMRFGAVDQTVKNSMLVTEDGIHWFFILYDNDTIFGVRNDGLLRYEPTISRQTEDSEIGGYAYAGNGSVLWNNFEADEECMAMTKQIDAALYTAGLTYENVINMFNTQQAGKWSEIIYNKDAQYKYIGPYVNQALNYLGSMQGSRSDHRKWWISQRFALYDALYVSGAYAGTAITLLIPGAKQGTKFSIKSGKDFYYGYGENNLTLESGVFVEAGKTHEFSLAKNMEIGSPLRIYAPYYIDTLDLSNFMEYIGATNFNLSAGYSDTLGSKLKTLILGNGNKKNNALNGLSGLAKLTTLEILNIEGYVEIKSLDLSTLVNLKYFYADESGLTSVLFAEGSPIEYIDLPHMQSLVLRSLPRLTSNNISSYYDEITNIEVRNCPNISNDINFILNWMGKGAYKQFETSVYIDNIDWRDVKEETLIKIGELKENGCNLILRGSVYLESTTQDGIQRLTELFGADAFKEGAQLYISAPDEIYLTGPVEVLEGESAKYNAIIFSQNKGTVTYLIASGSRSGTSINANGLLTTNENGLSDSNLTIRAIHRPKSGTTIYTDLDIVVKQRTYPNEYDVSIEGESNLNDPNNDRFQQTITYKREITGNLIVEWSLGGDIAQYVSISKGDNNGCELVRTELPVDFEITGTITAIFKKTINGQKVATITKNIGILRSDIALASSIDYEFMKLMYDNGFAANENYMTKEEAARISEIDLQPGTEPSTSIFNSVISKIKDLTSLYWFTGLTKLPDYLLYCSYRNDTCKIRLPKNVNRFGNSCLRQGSITNFEPFSIENIVEEVDEYAFYCCNITGTVILSDNLTEIKGFSFYLTNIDNVVAGKQLTYILDSAFCRSKLKNIVLPEKTIKLSSYALATTELTNIDGRFACGETISSKYIFSSSKIQDANIKLIYDLNEKMGYMFASCRYLHIIKIILGNLNGTDICANIQEYFLYDSKCNGYIEFIPEYLSNKYSIQPCAFYRFTGNIIFRSTTPQSCASSSFSSFVGKIYVPFGCGESYKTASNWTTVADKIYELTEDGNIPE